MVLLLSKQQMYSKTITSIRFGFSDIQDNLGLCKGYQPQPLALANNPPFNWLFWISQKPHPIVIVQNVTSILIDETLYHCNHDKHIQKNNSDGTLQE